VCNLVTKAECNTLSLAADSDVPSNLAVWLGLNAHIRQSIFTKGASCVHIGGKEAAVFGSFGKALHVGRLDNVLHEFVEISDSGVDDDFVLPFELGPHSAEHCVCAAHW